MSLRDTIEGARREAEGNAAGRPKKEVATVVGEEKKGFSKSSASKARPAREAAASVRTVSSSYKAGTQTAPETKQEKRERRERERSENTLRTRAYDLVLRDNAEYRSCEKTFWIIVGTGTFFAVASLVETYVFGQNVDLTSWQGVLCVVPDRKLFSVKEMVHSVDPKAFITISKINEVRGRGFTLDRSYKREA